MQSRASRTLRPGSRETWQQRDFCAAAGSAEFTAAAPPPWPNDLAACRRSIGSAAERRGLVLRALTFARCLHQYLNKALARSAARRVRICLRPFRPHDVRTCPRTNLASNRKLSWRQYGAWAVSIVRKRCAHAIVEYYRVGIATVFGCSNSLIAILTYLNHFDIPLLIYFDLITLTVPDSSIHRYFISVDSQVDIYDEVVR